jgi:hypothetical protein
MERRIRRKHWQWAGFVRAQWGQSRGTIAEQEALVAGQRALALERTSAVRCRSYGELFVARCGQFDEASASYCWATRAVLACGRGTGQFDASRLTDQAWGPS